MHRSRESAGIRREGIRELVLILHTDNMHGSSCLLSRAGDAV